MPKANKYQLKRTTNRLYHLAFLSIYRRNLDAILRTLNLAAQTNRRFESRRFSDQLDLRWKAWQMRKLNSNPAKSL